MRAVFHKNIRSLTFFWPKFEEQRIDFSLLQGKIYPDYFWDRLICCSSLEELEMPQWVKRCSRFSARCSLASSLTNLNLNKVRLASFSSPVLFRGLSYFKILREYHISVVTISGWKYRLLRANVFYQLCCENLTSNFSGVCLDHYIALIAKRAENGRFTKLKSITF